MFISFLGDTQVRVFRKKYVWEDHKHKLTVWEYHRPTVWEYLRQTVWEYLRQTLWEYHLILCKVLKSLLFLYNVRIYRSK